MIFSGYLNTRKPFGLIEVDKIKHLNGDLYLPNQTNLISIYNIINSPGYLNLMNSINPIGKRSLASSSNIFLRVGKPLKY